ncbi:TrbI/VirB10 family protein [Sphingomonas lenta]|nr:TrbI/VirB10 family protein [Sphingomonas lenta]
MSAGVADPNLTPEASAERDPRPVVALPRSGLPGAVIAAVAVLLALVLFAVLNAQRQRASTATAAAGRASTNAFVAPPPLVVPAEPAPVPTPPTVTVVTTPAPVVPVPPSPSPVAPAPPPPAPAPAPVILPVPPPAPEAPAAPAEPPPARLGAPALVIDVGPGEAVAADGPATAAGRPRTGGAPASALGDTAARASTIRNRTTVMPVGTLIPAVLETPIDTARPGLVRAVVSQDARGFDGRRVLIPRGSRLIGEYQSDVRSGQNRVLVTWARLIRPDGVAIALGSPAADRLGGAGVPGRVNTFFLQRFAGAVLQSALTVGVNLASRPGDGSVIVGLPTGQINNAVGQGLIPNDLRPKITVRQGAALNVFVARDLDFSGTPAVGR